MAGVKRFEVHSRQTVFDGMACGEQGEIGPYELLSGRAILDIDPAHVLNQGIVHLEHAPRRADGLVEYGVDFHIYKPVDLARGNGWLFYEYLNRGTQRGITRINNAPYVALPTKSDDIGNGFLFHQGYAVIYTAWQGNVEPGGGRMLAEFPVARKAGDPITGMACEEFILDAPDSIRGAQLQELDEHRYILTLSYPAAGDIAASDASDASDAALRAASKATLTVRQYEGDARIAAGEMGISWRFLDAHRIEVQRHDGCTLDRGAIFEFIYEACDPVVMGLGYASVRDVMAFLKYASHDAAGVPNPLAMPICADGTREQARALGFGLSQSGRVLRDFLLEGFNESVEGQQVFDAAVPIIAGSRRAWVNAPFSQPGRYSRQHEDHRYPGDQFPFTYSTVTDPVSGRTDGILARARASGTCPKVIHLDTDSEVWSARASLVATDCEGHDLPEDPDVRLYLTTGVAHGDYPLPHSPVVRYATNPLTYGATLRALFVAMREWVDEGIAPPPSQFPSHADGSWWTVERFMTHFEQSTGLVAPQAMNVLRLLDHSTVPATPGASYPAFVPAVDMDGNGSAGVRHPLIQAPLGTHAGWALRAPGFAEGALYSVYGSFIAFAASPAAQATPLGEDRRLPLDQRYASRQHWKEAVVAAAQRLVEQRLLLPVDAHRLATSVDTVQDPFHVI